MIHKIIVTVLTVAAYIALAGLGQMIGENTMKGNIPSWACYIGSVVSLLAFGFFNGVFKP